MTTDLYDLLQVSPGAAPEVIHAAYRALARQCHPDVSGDPEAPKAMRRLNAAYQVLSNPARRARYDALLARRSGLRVRRSVPSVRRTSELPVVTQRASSTRIVILAIGVAFACALLLAAVWAMDDGLDTGSPYAPVQLIFSPT
jgi:curved DNA-binding protein CbpA